MFERRPRSLWVIHDHSAMASIFRFASDDDCWHLKWLDRSGKVSPEKHGVCNRDNSVYSATNQHLQTLMKSARCVLKIGNYRHISESFQGVLYTPHDQAAIRVRDVEYKDSDAVGSLASERSRLKIRRISKLARGILHSPVGRSWDPAARLVENHRYCGCR